MKTSSSSYHLPNNQTYKLTSQNGGVELLTDISVNYSTKDKKNYCFECGRDIPSKFMPKQEETVLCFYCNRKNRPRF